MSEILLRGMLNLEWRTLTLHVGTRLPSNLSTGYSPPILLLTASQLFTYLQRWAKRNFRNFRNYGSSTAL